MGLIILYHSEIIFPPRQTTKSNLPQHKYWFVEPRTNNIYCEHYNIHNTQHNTTSISKMNLNRAKQLSILEINFLRKKNKFTNFPHSTISNVEVE